MEKLLQILKSHNKFLWDLLEDFNEDDINQKYKDFVYEEWVYNEGRLDIIKMLMTGLGEKEEL